MSWSRFLFVPREFFGRFLSAARAKSGPFTRDKCLKGHQIWGTKEQIILEVTESEFDGWKLLTHIRASEQQMADRYLSYCCSLTKAKEKWPESIQKETLGCDIWEIFDGGTKEYRKWWHHSNESVAAGRTLNLLRNHHPDCPAVLLLLVGRRGHSCLLMPEVSTLFPATAAWLLTPLEPFHTTSMYWWL